TSRSSSLPRAGAPLFFRHGRLSVDGFRDDAPKELGDGHLPLPGDRFQGRDLVVREQHGELDDVEAIGSRAQIGVGKILGDHIRNTHVHVSLLSAGIPAAETDKWPNPSSPARRAPKWGPRADFEIIRPQNETKRG